MNVICRITQLDPLRRDDQNTGKLDFGNCIRSIQSHLYTKTGLRVHFLIQPVIQSIFF
jgi:hypothetical protein